MSINRKVSNVLIKYIKLYIELAKQNIKITLEYRTEFIIGALSSFLINSCGILFIWVIFNNIQQINGWGFYEITLMYGLITASKGFSGIFFSALWAMGNRYIAQGHFDQILLKPVNTLFYLFAERLNNDEIGNFLIGSILIFSSFYALGITLTFIHILMLLLFFVCGVIIYTSILLITASSTFWVVRAGPIMWSVYETNEFAKYPLTIYNKYIRHIFTWVIPYGFASFYPANYFLNKGYQHISVLSPVVAVALWMVALKIWKFGVRNYSSTGS